MSSAQSTAPAAPPEAVADVDVESQTTYGSFQAESPRPWDPSPAGSTAESVHSVHLSHLRPHELKAISRIWTTSRDLEPPPAPPHRNLALRALRWWTLWAVPGMGMFVEAWMIFAIGNIAPLLKINFPHCFGGEQPYSCSQSAAGSATYVEVCGIILGMLGLGFCADIIGRKWGSRLSSSTMLLGGAVLTGCAGSGDAGFLAMFLVGLFVLGAGVGGEYPVASSSAAERAEGSKQMRRRRGETVLLTFSQQGWGNLSQTLCMIILLAAQGATGDVVTSTQADITWRVQFAVGTSVALALTAYRYTYLQESKVWTAERHDVAEQLARTGAKGHHSWREYLLAVQFYWPRLLATSLGWGLSGFMFYGQKLYQAAFITVIAPGATVFKVLQYTLLNSGVSLAGYYAAAALIDRPWFGRVRMQALGFFMLFLLFILIAALYNVLATALGAFQFLYLWSGFWQNLGPNATTWLVASEVYPTSIRAFCNGVSAAVGKVGALVAAALFSGMSPRTAFYASAGVGLAGCLLTLLFLPDTTGLDLHEIDRMHRYIVAGTAQHYHGEACNPRFLSRYERMRRYDQHYHPERDYAHKQLQRHPHMPPEPLLHPPGPASGRATPSPALSPQTSRRVWATPRASLGTLVEGGT